MVEAFKRQLNDPTTTLDGLNCTPDSTAMAMYRASGGKVDVYGGQVRERCMESGVWPSGVKDTTGGTNLNQNITAAGTFGVTLVNKSGGTWADFLNDVAAGRGAVIQGTGGSACGFLGDHAEYVASVNLVTKTAVVGDPICLGFKTITFSQLQTFMRGLAFADGGLRYAVTPITGEAMHTFDLIPGAKTGTLTVKADAPHSYLRLLDGTLHAASSAWAPKQAYGPITLVPPIPGGVAGADRATAYLIGLEAAAMLASDVNFTATATSLTGYTQTQLDAAKASARAAGISDAAAAAAATK